MTSRGWATVGADELPRPARAIVMDVRYSDHELAFFSIFASSGTPADITVDGLAIESLLPADTYTAEALRQAHAAPQ